MKCQELSTDVRQVLEHAQELKFQRKQFLTYLLYFTRARCYEENMREMEKLLSGAFPLLENGKCYKILNGKDANSDPNKFVDPTTTAPRVEIEIPTHLEQHWQSSRGRIFNVLGYDDVIPEKKAHNPS